MLFFIKFGRSSEPPHLKEVDAIWYVQKKFHGFDEERTKRFAYICLAGEGFRNLLSELGKYVDFQSFLALFSVLFYSS